MANTYVERTIATGSSPNKLTISCWMKGMADASGSEQRTFFGFRDNGDTDRFFTIYTSTNGSLYAYWKDSSTVFTLGTSQKFRDPSAWGHWLLAMDTTDATAADRVKMYWNGERITSFQDGLDTITQNKVMDLTGDTDGRITVGGGKTQSTFHYWDGCMAHVQYVDGLALTPTEFGETDSTSGIWKLKTGSYATPGTNGFHLKMEDRTNLDLDSSSNTHTFTTSGTLTPTYDNPSNNFCILNPLENYYAAMPFSQGNNTVVSDYPAPATSTMGLTSGKWYFEGKAVTRTSGDDWQFGISSNEVTAASNELGHYSNDYAYFGANGNSRTNNTNTAYGDSYASGDIIGCAVDLTNNKLYFSKNGTWQDSGDPTSGSTGTGAISITAPASTPLGAYFVAVGANANVSANTWSMNFGNGYFGTTAVASTNADDAGIGSFEYDVPTGYYALCTNNLGDQS